METSLSPQAGEHRVHEPGARPIPLIPRHNSELEKGHEAGDPPGGRSWVLTRSWRGAGMLTAPWGTVLGEAFAELQWVGGKKKKKIKIRCDDDLY